MKMIKYSIAMFALCLSGAAFALNSDANEFYSKQLVVDNILPGKSFDQNYRSRERSPVNSVLQPLRQAQSDQSRQSLRSKSEVMQEVKKRYNGKVVKMSLNERTAMYSVRVLLPSGMIKNISVSARR